MFWSRTTTNTQQPLHTWVLDEWSLIVSMLRNCVSFLKLWDLCQLPPVIIKPSVNPSPAPILCFLMLSISYDPKINQNLLIGWQCSSETNLPSLSKALGLVPSTRTIKPNLLALNEAQILFQSYCFMNFAWATQESSFVSNLITGISLQNMLTQKMTYSKKISW